MIIKPMERTVVETFDPSDGDKRVRLLTLEGVTLTVDGPLTIDGKKWAVTWRPAVEINTKASRITTTITVIEDV